MEIEIEWFSFSERYYLSSCRIWNNSDIIKILQSEIIIINNNNYIMDLVGVQEVRWVDSGTLESGNYKHFVGNVMLIINYEQCFLFIGELVGTY